MNVYPPRVQNNGGPVRDPRVSNMIDLTSSDEDDSEDAFEDAPDHIPDLDMRARDLPPPQLPVRAAFELPNANADAPVVLNPPHRRPNVWGDYVLDLSDDEFDLQDLDFDHDLVMPHHLPNPPALAESQAPSPPIVIAADILESRVECVDIILNMFPDICRDYASELYDTISKSSERLIAHILDKMDKGTMYPSAKEKQRKLKRKRAVDEDEEAARKYGAVDRIMSAHAGGIRPFIRSILSFEFALTPMNFIDATLNQSGYRLFSAYQVLEEAQRMYDQAGKPYQKLRNPRKNDDFKEDKISAYLANPTIGPGGVVDREKVEVFEELQASRRIRAKADARRAAEHAAELEEEENVRKAESEGTMSECGCCYSDYPLNRMVHCNSDNTHWFCRGCTKQNAEVEIGKSKYELFCMSTDKCSAGFSTDQRAQFLDDNTRVALERNEQEANLRLAGIENLASCPFCPYAAEYPPVEVDREFRCQAPDCERTSCRLCKLESHIPKSCEEHAKENGLSIRRQIEEAMSAAMIRKCNKCGTPFVKEEGCNKMTCTRGGCRNIQCYVCSKSCDYNHFNDTSRGGKDGNCPLFESAEQRHIDEVNKAEKEALEKVLADHPEYTEEDLKVKMSENVKKDDARRISMDPRVRHMEALNLRIAGGRPGFRAYPYMDVDEDMAQALPNGVRPRPLFAHAPRPVQPAGDNVIRAHFAAVPLFQPPVQVLGPPQYVGIGAGAAAQNADPWANVLQAGGLPAPRPFAGARQLQQEHELQMQRQMAAFRDQQDQDQAAQRRRQELEARQQELNERQRELLDLMQRRQQEQVQKQLRDVQVQDAEGIEAMARAQQVRLDLQARIRERNAARAGGYVSPRRGVAHWRRGGRGGADDVPEPPAAEEVKVEDGPGAGRGNILVRDAQRLYPGAIARLGRRDMRRGPAQPDEALPEVSAAAKPFGHMTPDEYRQQLARQMAMQQARNQNPGRRNPEDDAPPANAAAQYRKGREQLLGPNANLPEPAGVQVGNPAAVAQRSLQFPMFMDLDDDEGWANHPPAAAAPAPLYLEPRAEGVAVVRARWFGAVDQSQEGRSPSISPVAEHHEGRLVAGTFRLEAAALERARRNRADLEHINLEQMAQVQNRPWNPELNADEAARHGGLERELEEFQQMERRRLNAAAPPGNNNFMPDAARHQRDAMCMRYAQRGIDIDAEIDAHVAGINREVVAKRGRNDEDAATRLADLEAQLLARQRARMPLFAPRNPAQADPALIPADALEAMNARMEQRLAARKLGLNGQRPGEQERAGGLAARIREAREERVAAMVAGNPDLHHEARIDARAADAEAVIVPDFGGRERREFRGMRAAAADVEAAGDGDGGWRRIGRRPRERMGIYGLGGEGVAGGGKGGVDRYEAVDEDLESD